MDGTGFLAGAPSSADDVDSGPQEQAGLAACDDPQFLLDCLGMLEELDRGQIRPERAQAHVARLRERWPGPGLTLVWDIEEANGSVAYDLLIEGPVRTLSLAVAGTSTLPWPLRGVTRSSERDLVRVGRTRLQVADALAALEFVWEQPGVLARVVDTGVVRGELLARPVAPDEDRIQQCADAFRRGKGLLTAEDTHRWLRLQGLDDKGFHDRMVQLASLEDLRERLVGSQADELVERQRGALATLTFAWVVQVAGPQDPLSLSGELALQPEVLLQVADAVRRGLPAGLVRQTVLAAPAELREAATGIWCETTVAGQQARAVVLFRDPVRDEAQARRVARVCLFDLWLAEQRGRADVEWFWGSAERTDVLQHPDSSAVRDLAADGGSAGTR